MQKTITFFFFILSVVLFTACKKGEPIETYSFAKFQVNYKSFVDAPDVTVNIDSISMGVLTAGSGVSKLASPGGKKMKLTVKRASTGEVLLDSTFTPGVNNLFTLFISDALGISEFYTPPATQPQPDKIRIQLFHHIKTEVEHKVNFKFYTDPVGDGSVFEPTEYELNNVAYGQLSEVIDLPGDAQYYIKTYDAETGEILLDLFEGFYGYGLISADLGKQEIIEVVAPYDPEFGIFYDIFKIYPL